MQKSTFIILLSFIYSLTTLGQNLSIQEKLGYSRDAKLLIIHADDIGVSHSENAASIYALEHGSVNSGSIMVPCPWFPEIAAYAKNHPDADFGIHLTLNSEWTYYKWGPISSPEEVPGLINDTNHLFDNWDDVKNNASAQEIEKELRSQIETALKYGINPTHLDTHMFALYLKPEFLAVYKKLGKEYKLPVLLNKAYLNYFELNAEENLNDEDIVVDNIYMAFPEDFKKGMNNYYIETLRNLPIGLNVLLLHAAFNNEEMKAITIGKTDFGAEWRQQDFNFFTSDVCKQILKEEKIELITWKEIKNKLFLE